MKDEDIRALCTSFIYDSEESQRNSDKKSRAESNQDFFRGGTHQWTSEEYNIYKSKGVTPVTINRCRPVIRSAMGMYDQQKQAVSALPRKGATVHSAAVYTELLKHAQDNSNAEFVYSELMFRGLVDTEAYIVLDIDQEKNPNGQIEFHTYPLEDVDCDPTTKKYDINHKKCPSKFAIVKEWIDKDELKAQYGNKLEDYQQDYGITGMGELASKLVNYLYESDGSVEGTPSEEDNELVKKYRQRVRYIYWIEIRPGALITDSKTGRKKTVTDKDKIDKVTGTKSKRFKVRRKKIRVLHKTVMLGGVMLEDIESPLGETFTNIPVYRFAAFWDLGYAQGLLDDVISLNREENIHRTQSIKILNQTANSGHKVADGSNKKAVQELADFGSVDGIIIDEKKFGGRVDKIQPNQIPTGFFMQSQQFEQDVKRVAGFDDATMGYETGRTESGKALQLKNVQNRATSAMIFINFYYTLTLLGRDMLQIIRDKQVYTDEEIIAVVEKSSLLDYKYLAEVKNELVTGIGADLPKPSIPQYKPEILNMIRPQDRMKVNRQLKIGIESAIMYQNNYPQLAQHWVEVIKARAINKLLEEIKSSETAEYGIKVTVAPTAPTERIARRVELETLMDKYPNVVPPDIYIDSTELPNKDEIKSRVMINQQAASMSQAGVA